MKDDDYLDSVEVIAEICKAHGEDKITEIQAIRRIVGILGQDTIKKGNAIAIIKNLCEAYNKRHINKEAALYGIMGSLRTIDDLDEILEADE